MKKTRLLLTVLILILFLSSCASENRPTCRELLDSIMSVEIGLPAGKIYSSLARKDDPEFFPDSLISALYGNGETPKMADGWIDLAVFLPSSSHVCEFAIFLCDSKDTATDTARMLCKRLDAIRTVKGNPDNIDVLDGAAVSIRGNYVMLIISSDTQNALKSVAKNIH